MSSPLVVRNAPNLLVWIVFGLAVTFLVLVVSVPTLLSSSHPVSTVDHGPGPR